MDSSLGPNLGLDLVRASEAAALAAGRWVGRGDGQAADRAASAAMLAILNTIPVDGTIVIGEEGRLSAGAAYSSGQRVGAAGAPRADLILDPIDGTALVAQGQAGAIAAVAVAPAGAVWCPAPAVYIEKIVVNGDVAPALVPECLDAPAAWTLALVARAKRKPVSDLIVFVLDRPRHADLVAEIRAAGACVMLRAAGDIAGALMAASYDGAVDLLMGTGGIVEGLIAACALKALGGAMLARLSPQSHAEREAVAAAGLDTRRILGGDEIVSGDVTFFAATGITDGPLLSGVRFDGRRARSNSLILRGETRTRRMVVAEHLLQAGR